MPDDMEPTSQKQVTLIPIDRVRVLNPRVATGEPSRRWWRTSRASV